MAWSVPKIGAVATVASGNITLAEPSGIAAGDLMVACIGSRGNAAFTVPGDWNLVATQQNIGDTDATNGIASGVMMWCVRGGSAPTLTFNRTAGDVAQGRIIAYSGGHPSAPYDTGSSATGATTVVGAGTASINTATAGELLVAMTSLGDTLSTSTFDAATDPTTASNGTNTTTAPTAGTWIERADSSTGTGADHGLAIADAIRATAGSTGAFTATGSGTGRHVMIVGAFKLAPVNTTLTADAGSYALTGNAATLRRSYQLVATAGNYTSTGNNAALSKGFRIAATAGSYALTGNAVAQRRTYNLVATAGAYSLTGNTAALRRTYHLVATVGSYALTGISAGLAKGFRLIATAGSYALTGNAAATRWARRLVATAGAYISTGQTVALRWSHRIAAAVGSYALTGNNVTLSHSGGLTHYTLTALTGSYGVTGNAATLRRTYRLPASVGSYTLTGNSIGLLKGTRLNTVAGSYSLTGNLVGLTYSGDLILLPLPFFLDLESGETCIELEEGSTRIDLVRE